VSSALVIHPKKVHGKGGCLSGPAEYTPRMMDIEIHMNILSKRFAERVRARRSKLGLSQTAVALRANITRQAVSQIESGETRRVSLEVAIALAEALRTRLSELVKP